MKRFFWVSAAAAVMMWNTAVCSYAGWEQTAMGWTYKDDKKDEYVTTGWKWIDGNQDGISECYYFADGILLTGTKTPDGSLVDNNGAKIENGKVAIKVSKSKQKEGEEETDQEALFRAEFADELSKLYAGMQAQGHIFVMTEMEKPSYTKLLQKLPSEGFCYPTGDGVGMQINQKYLYYGDLKGGRAEGEGTVYTLIGNAPSGKTGNPVERYGYHTGTFADNAANGPGEDYIYYHDSELCVHISGTYQNWYQRGEMTCVRKLKSQTATFHYTIDGTCPPIRQYRALNGKKVGVTAIAEEEKSAGVFLAMDGHAQTAAHIALDDHVAKNTLLFNK